MAIINHKTFPPTLSRQVVCAAIRHRKTGLIVCGARHMDDIMRAQIRAIFPIRYFLWKRVLRHFRCGNPFTRWDQGFIDQKQVYLTRTQAWELAVEAGQIQWAKDRPPGELFSEDLY